jgi:hypothetical protein
MGDFPTQQLLETSERVAKRWKDALGEIEKAQYGPKEWLKDAVGFWTHDVADVWLGAGAGTSVVLLTQNNQTSDEIPVTNVAKTVLTTLGQLGGTKVIQLDLDNTTYPKAVTVAVPPGGVVFIQPPTGGTLVSGEQYVGLLYEDQTPVATVIYLRL